MPDNNEESRMPPKTQYSSVSKQASEPEKQTERRVPKSVVSTPGVERKPSLGRRFRETFAGDPAQSVGQHLFYNVVIPATKNLLYDMLTEGGRRLLFGSSGNANPGVATGAALIAGAARTSYTKMFQSGQQQTTGRGPAPAVLLPSMNDYSQIVVATREEALTVIEALVSLIDEYGSATVADLYACVGRTGDYTNIKFGWKTLSTAEVRNVREGFLIDLPRPVALD